MMAKISKIAVPGVVEPYDIEAYKALSIPFGQVDSTSTDTAYTAQIEGITSLYDGVCVYLKNGVITSNKNGFTLNINGLGAKPVYGTLAVATRSGTVFNINYTMLFVYNSSRVEDGCWDIFYGYNSDTNTIAYNVRVGATPPATSNKLVKYGIAFTKTDGKLLSSNTTGTTVTSKALTSVAFDPYAPMYYYPTTAVSANAVPAASYTYQQYSTVDLRYAFNAGATLVEGDPVYIRCVPQSDGTVKLDGNNCIVQALPSTDDSKVYIYLGYAYSTTNIFFDIKHPVYCIRDGKREFWHGDKHYWADIIDPPVAFTPSSHTHNWVDINDPPATYSPSSHTHSYTDISGLGSLATVNTVPWSSITNTPATYTPSSHTHDYAPSSHSHVWSAITNPPSTYTPSTHSHAWSEITNTPSTYTPSSHNHTWSQITNTPATYTPSAHNHGEYAPIASPSFTGTPTAPTPTADNDSTQIANTGWVRDRIDGLGTVFNLKGTKADAVSLPTINNTIGDVWYVAAESVGYIWLKDEANQERWEKFGEPIELPATYTPSAHTHSHTDISGLGSLATVNTIPWSSVTNTPTTYTPSSHTHTWANISNPPSSYTPSAHTHDYAASSHSHTWSAITNPPSSYTPSSHTHTWANISDPPSSYTPSAHTHAWANISNPPSSYTPSAHSHAWSEITNTPATYTPSTHTHSDLAPINSPQLTGNPTAPSPNEGDNSTAIANTSWVNSAISSAIEAIDDVNVTNTLATTTKYYITGTTSTVTETGTQVFDTGVYATTVTGELSAVRHSYNVDGTEKAYVTYNSTTDSLDFIFA